MPDPRTITVTSENAVALEDGKGYTVTLPSNVTTEEELSTNFVTKEIHQRHVDGVQGRIDSVQQTAQAGARETLMKDDTFLDAAIKGRVDFFKERFPEAGETVDVESLQNQLREAEVKPLEVKLEGLTEENSGLKSKAVRGDIIDMMSADGSTIMDEHRDMFESYAAGRVRWSEELHRPVAFGDEGKVAIITKDGEQRPMTIREWGASLMASGKFDTYFVAKTGKGAGVLLVETTPENIKEQIDAAVKAGDWALKARLNEKQAQALTA